MCVCNPNNRTPYCDSFECQEALKNKKEPTYGPVRIGILEDNFIAAMDLLSQARSPRIEFKNDLEKMSGEALDETIKKVSEAYSLLAKDHSNF